MEGAPVIAELNEYGTRGIESRLYGSVRNRSNHFAALPGRSGYRVATLAANWLSFACNGL